MVSSFSPPVQSTLAQPRTAEEMLKHLSAFHWHYDRLAMLVTHFLAWRVNEFFEQASLPVLHLYQHRAKTVKSLENNMRVPDRYPDIILKHVTDLAGARLIFYFDDDLRVFCHDRRRFEDWFGHLAVAQFKHVEGSRRPDGSRETPGYDSYHFPIQVTRDTIFWDSLQSIDQDQLTGLFCEVQLRTILRHAWAETEHDLRYKVENVLGLKLPKAHRQSFRRLAGSVQKADQTLVDRKADIVAALRKAGNQLIASRAQGWHYTPAPSGHLINGVSYDYEVLHSPAAGQHELNVRQIPDIFDLDHTMESKLKIERYKDSVWQILRKEEPEFIAHIDRDSLVVRVCAWDSESATVSVQPAHYSDQVVTNHKKAHNKVIPTDDQRRAVRSLAFGADGLLLRFNESPLSNTLGVACVVRLETDYWVVAERSAAVAFDPEMWGCSASGALEWTELGYWTTRDFGGWFKGGMARECEEELGYRASVEKFIYLGLARELGRLGKPQLFFLLDLPNDRARLIESMWSTYTAPRLPEPSSRAEFKKLIFVPTKDAKVLVGRDEAAAMRVTGGARMSEELRMNLALALQHLGET